MMHYDGITHPAPHFENALLNSHDKNGLASFGIKQLASNA
jgi:hypothetical protein